MIDRGHEILHTKVVAFASGIASLSAQKWEGRSEKLMSRRLFHHVGSDTVKIHRAALSLCHSGWAPVSFILVRSLFEGLIAQIVTVQAKDSEMMAFRYLTSYLQEGLRDPSLRQQPDALKEMQDMLDRHLEGLPPESSAIAKAFIYQEKPRAFWYQPEFSRPTDIIEKHAPGLLAYYRGLSSAVHLGRAGLARFSDTPNTVSINPQPEPAAAAMAIGTSCRIVLEITAMRARWDELNVLNTYNSLLTELVSLRPLVAQAQQPPGKT